MMASTKVTERTRPLIGELVRLEPLEHRHVPGLVAAAAEEPSLYRWTSVPQGEAQMGHYVEAAAACRDAGTAVPFAVIRLEDDTVLGSTRLWELDYWTWLADREANGTRGTNGPDVCEIGHTWLAGSAIRTGVNVEMKLLMLALAFDDWRVRRVCFHTDARNVRSYAALERLGARFEGILRAHRVAADQTVRDSARFSVTAAEWPGVRRRLEERLARHRG